MTHLSDSHVPMEFVLEGIMQFLQRHGREMAEQIVVFLLLDQLQVDLLEPSCELGTEYALTGKITKYMKQNSC